MPEESKIQRMKRYREYSADHLASMVIDMERSYDRLSAKAVRQRRDASTKERAKIVSWLRGDYKYNRNAQGFADAIEKGEHEHPKGPPNIK